MSTWGTVTDGPAPRAGFRRPGPAGAGAIIPRLPRAALVRRIVAGAAPVVAIEAPAGMGKTWLLEDIADALPDARIWDVPPVPHADPLPETVGRLILARRPTTAIPGLARAAVYGRVDRILPEDLLLAESDFRLAGLSPDAARAAMAQTGGWPCLVPAVIGGHATPAVLAEFLRDEIVADLPSAGLVAWDAHLDDPARPADPGLLAGLPFVRPGGPLHPALVATRGPLRTAIREVLDARSTDPTEARAIAVAQAALGRAPQAIATFQGVGAWQAAIRTLQQAGGPFFIHRFGPQAFDRMLAGFPADLLAQDETLVLCRAIQAVKRGELPLTQRILADRWGPAMADAGAVMEYRARHSLDLRFFRLLLRTWEDFELPECYLEDAFRLLAEIPAEDDLRRGSFYNAVLEFYIRVRRFAEAEHVAQRAADHYSRAGVPILSFYIDLHQAIIQLFQGDPGAARGHAAAAGRHLRAARYDSPGDVRLLALLDACIGFETGQSEALHRFLSTDLDALTQGEIWPTLVELALTYGSQALAESYSPLSARAFLDRWRVRQEQSSQFRSLIDIREVALLQSAGRWAEAAQKAAAMPGRMTLAEVQAGDGRLATIEDRDDVAMALIWLRQMAQVSPTRPGLDALIATLADNPHLTGRQRTAAALWQAHVLRRQRRLPEAEAMLTRALGRAAQTGAFATLAEERVFLTDLLSTRRLRDAAERVEPAGRLLRRLTAPGPARAAGLTRQETRMLRAIGEGAGNKAIANMLGLSESTVKFHLANLYRKLGVRGRRQAVASAAALRLLG